MALKVLTTSSNLSTSDGNWLTSIAGKLANLYNGDYNDDVNTARYAPSTTGTTVTNGVNANGVYLMLTSLATPGAATITVDLEENTGAWTQKATSGALTISTIKSDGITAIYIPFTTPYVTTANNFRIKVSCNTASKIGWYRSDTAGDYFYSLMSDTSTARPTSSDTMLLGKNVTLTVDENCTLTANTNASVVIGDGATLTWQNPASASYTLNLGAGYIFFSSNGKLKIGTSGSRITRTNQAKITTSYQQTVIRIPTTSAITFGYSTVQIELYGEYEDFALKTSQKDNSGQSYINTVEDIPASWAVNDFVTLISKDRIESSDAQYYKINTVSTKQIRLGNNTTGVATNLDYNSLKDGRLLNMTVGATNGISIKSTYASQTPFLLMSVNARCDYYIFDGVYFGNVQIITPENNLFSVSTKPCEVKNVYYDAGVTINAYTITIASSVSYPITVSNFHSGNLGMYSSSTGTVFSNCKKAAISDFSIKNGGASSTTFILGGAGSTISDFALTQIKRSEGIYSSISNVTFTDGIVVGGINVLSGGTNNVFNNVRQGASGGIGFRTSSPIIYLNNVSLGVIASNVSAAIDSINANTKIVSKGLTFTGTLCANYLGNLNQYGYFTSIDHNGTTGNYLTLLSTGKIDESSGKAIMTTENISNPEKLMTFLDMITGDVSGIKMSCSIYAQLGQTLTGNYYAPFFTAYYNNGSSISATGANNTSRNKLSNIFTLTTDKSPINFEYGYKSSTVNDTCTFDTFFAAARKYGYTFYELTKVIEKLEHYPIGEVPSLTTNPNITQPTEATVSAYSGISINHSTQTCTITTAHTIAELYDYTQYNLTLDANMGYSEWFTTTNGETYTSTYNIIVDGAALSGTGKAIDLGSMDFSTINGGSTTALISDVDGTIVPIVINGIVNGAQILVEKTDHTEIANITSSGTSYSFSYNWTTNVDVNIIVRKGSSAPYYQPYTTTGTITNTGLSVNASLIPDTVRTSYPGGISSDWTITDANGNIAHTAGTTVYTIRELYSWLMDYYDQSAKMRYTVPMSAQTAFDYTYTATMSDADHAYLKGGSITEASGNTLWANVYTIGSIYASSQLYIAQNSTVLTPTWSTGHIDVILKVKSGGSLIDSGYVTIFDREYGYLYDHYKIDLSNGGRNVAPLATSADSNNETASGTVATWTDITVTEGAASKDIGDGGGNQPYSVVIACAGRPVAQVYEYLKYITRRSSTYTLRSDDGQEYTRINDAYTEVKTAPFGTFAGGVFFAAQGVWIEGMDTLDTQNYYVMDNNGVARKEPAPLGYQSVTVTGATAGSRIQIYDLTSSTELYNGTPTFPYTWEDTNPYSADREIRLRVAYQNGTSAKTFIDTVIGTCTEASPSVSYLVTQTADSVYDTNAVDGSTVTDITITDASMLVSVSTGSISLQELYAYETYWLFTEEGIRDEGRFIDAPDTANYIWHGFQLKNTTSPTTPLSVTGGYVKDYTSGTAIAIVDTSGGTIFLAPDHVVPYSSGAEATVAIVQSGLTAQGYTTSRAPKLDTSLTKNQFIALSD